MGEEWKSTQRGNQWDVAVMESLMWAWKAFEGRGPALRQRGNWMARVINIKGKVSWCKGNSCKELGGMRSWEVVIPELSVCEILCACVHARTLRRERGGEVPGRQIGTILLKSPAARFCSSVLICEAASCRPRNIMKLITKRQGCQKPYTSLVSSSVKPELSPQDFF